MLTRILAIGMCIAWFGQQQVVSQEPASEAELAFVRSVAPLLREKCIACHGSVPDRIEGSLNLLTLGGLLRGGDSEKPSIVIGKPDESPLLLAVRRDHDLWSAMPPKEAERLSDEQIDFVRKWIRAGATWPNEARQAEITKKYAAEWADEDGLPVKTSGGLSPDWTNRRYKPDGLWAYQRVRKPTTSSSSKSNPIDELVEAKIPKDLSVASMADPRTFIRRATFDLTGLPPTPAQVVQFEKEHAIHPDKAVAGLVNRLLDSPHYGERMAQLWLDVVRYADSSGFANDYERGNAWRYRDYVVRSFNSDLPYNQFVREQLAGDEIDANDPEKLVATGFLRMGPWELTGMEVAKVARQRFLDDVTNSVGETFLAHSLQCARCHDHKFDPVPTRDYYSIQAVFLATQLVDRPAAFLNDENTQGFDERNYLKLRNDEFEVALQDVRSKVTVEAARAWFQETGRDSTEFEQALDHIKKTKPNEYSKAMVAAIRKRMQDQDVHPDLIPPPNIGFTPQDFGNERIARKGQERLKWEFDRYEPYALSVFNGRTPGVKTVNSPIRLPKEPMKEVDLEDACIRTGGDPFAVGEKVVPGVLSILGDIPNSAIPTEVEGRRLAFADWVAHEKNALTTRAIANRIWMWHFGDPIAGNPNNFGSTGKKPTNPELLDWLAASFVEQGWSFKSIHRVIMNSRVYRRSAEHPNAAELTKLDPLGTSLAVFKPRRLSAEELRDAMLAATGELNETLGGIPNRPEINVEAALQPRQVMGTFASAWIPNPLPSQRHRRSLYALKLRGLVDPAMEVFNLPAPDFSCEQREVSSITPQVFSLFNGRSSYARALSLAARACKENLSDEETLKRVYQIVFSRSPSDSELSACMGHWRKMETIQSSSEFNEHKLPTKVRRDAVEENTGEKFSFEETLHSNADFVSDLQPHEVDAKTRALADVCLVLFNSNEFIYVY
ncbi:MAG: DUF1549 domain-containing protein [Pirellula sp.]